MIQKFLIPFRLPGLNEVIAANRRNRFAGAKLKKETEQGILYAISMAGIQPVISFPVAVEMIFHEPNRRRDVDNVESAKKCILDALVQAGVLPGDSPRYVRAVPSYTVYGPDPCVEVAILPFEQWAANRSKERRV